MTKDAGIDIAFTTNGVLMTNSFVEQSLPFISWIKVSINAGSAESYEKIHRTKGDDFNKVLKNLRQAVRFRDQQRLHCTLGAQLLLLPENSHEVVELARICKQIGLDYLVVKPYSQHLMSETQQYRNVQYDEYLSLAQDLLKFNDKGFNVIFRTRAMKNYSQPDEKRYKQCHATPYFWAYIMADGSVYGCSAYLTDKRFEYGNINDQGFQEIWQSEARYNNWRFVREHLDISNCRKNCRMESINQYLDKLDNNMPEHVNFI